MTARQDAAAPPPSLGPWSTKNEVLLVCSNAEQPWNEAVVQGAPESNNLVALVFGYSPEGCHRRALLIGEAPDLLVALKPFADAAADLDCGEHGGADSDHIWEHPVAMNISKGDLRAAAAAIARATGGAA